MSFPNEWAILRPSANGIIWKHLLKKKVRVGLRFGARLAPPSPLISVWELVANAPQVRAAAAVTCSLLQIKSVGTNPDETWAERQSAVAGGSDDVSIDSIYFRCKPNALMRVARVVGFMPRSAAAPSGPKTLPWV